MNVELVVDSDGNQDTSRDALSAPVHPPPQTLSRHRESRTMDRAACRPGHYTGSEGSIAEALSAFYRPSTEITRCIPLCYEACRV